MPHGDDGGDVLLIAPLRFGEPWRRPFPLKQKI